MQKLVKQCAHGALVWCFGVAAALFTLSAHADWDKIKASGTLKVAVYKDFAPFSSGSGEQMQGMDIALAHALADAMGLKLELLPFDADEDMSDDLRNMVWKGTVIGYGPADVMLHVPVDRAFMQQQKQVHIFAPYYRETIVLAHDLKRLPKVSGAEDLKGQPLAAERGTAAASALVGALNGALRDKVRIEATPQQAVALLTQGEVAAVLATRAQIEAAIPANNRAAYGFTDLALGGVPAQGWVVGVAVKADDQALTDAVDKAMDKLKADGQIRSMYEHAGVTPVAP